MISDRQISLRYFGIYFVGIPCKFWYVIPDHCLSIYFQSVFRLLLLCSHSSNDVRPEPQRNVSIAAVRGAFIKCCAPGHTRVVTDCARDE